jgi:hypothetical protein
VGQRNEEIHPPGGAKIDVAAGGSSVRTSHLSQGKLSAKDGFSVGESPTHIV